MPYPALLVVLALVTLILWGIIFRGKGCVRTLEEWYKKYGDAR